MSLLNKGISIDNQKVDDENLSIDVIKKEFVVKKGKKTFLKVKIKC